MDGISTFDSEMSEQTRNGIKSKSPKDSEINQRIIKAKHKSMMNMNVAARPTVFLKDLKHNLEELLLDKSLIRRRSSMEDTQRGPGYKNEENNNKYPLIH